MLNPHQLWVVRHIVDDSYTTIGDEIQDIASLVNASIVQQNRDLSVWSILIQNTDKLPQEFFEGITGEAVRYQLEVYPSVLWTHCHACCHCLPF